MKKNKKPDYTDEPIGEIRIIKDFLPSPENLICKERAVKVTLTLTEESLEFFKQQAAIHHTQYQKMIRNLLSQYVARHKASKAD